MDFARRCFAGGDRRRCLGRESEGLSVGKRRVRITEKQLDKILDEAARAWIGGRIARTADSTGVTAALNRCEPDIATAHALVQVLSQLGLGRRAVYVLMMAASEDRQAGRLASSLPGPAWDRLYSDLAAQDALARSAYDESKPKELTNGTAD
jgi:hypothetical protein